MEQLFAYLGIWNNKVFSWIDIVGLFLFIAGFIIGLGAVTVIDLHGFLGRKSSYWTEATIRTHKITKPLIWIGMFLAIVGGIITYRSIGLTGTALIHAFLAVVLILNGCFLSFWVSPQLLRREKEGKARELLPTDLQMKIAMSFIISVIGWWSSLFLLIWYIVVLR
jgi:uncharacterized membrane protein